MVIAYKRIDNGHHQYHQLALCPAALLPELQPAPCFLSAIIGQT